MDHVLPLLCLIPANPDIAGIGVRVAIYVQNFLSFVPAFYAIMNDGRVDEQELRTTRNISITILVTAFSILISAIVQARSYGLSAFHASIILNLSWMNNTNTFIYFILWVHHRTHAPDGIKTTWTAWKKYIQRQLGWTSLPQDRDGARAGSIYALGTNTFHHLCIKTLTVFQKRIWVRQTGAKSGPCQGIRDKQVSDAISRETRD
jgi:hypothetical protein